MSWDQPASKSGRDRRWHRSLYNEYSPRLQRVVSLFFLSFHLHPCPSLSWRLSIVIEHLIYKMTERLALPVPLLPSGKNTENLLLLVFLERQKLEMLMSDDMRMIISFMPFSNSQSKKKRGQGHLTINEKIRILRFPVGSFKSVFTILGFLKLIKIS